MKSYDLVAVQPTADKIFQECCQSLDVDIITFDLSQKMDFRIKRNTVKSAMTRGVVFEICLNSALSGLHLLKDLGMYIKQ